MSDEETLRQLFQATRDDVVDDGFTRGVMQRVDRLRRRRRLVLGSAAAVGAAVSVPALWQAVQTLAVVPWTHLANQSVINATVLCVGAAALWVSVSALRFKRGGVLHVFARHPHLRIRQCLEVPVSSVQLMRITRGEHEAAESLQVRVRNHALNQPLAEPAVAMGIHDEDVAEPGECRAIGDDSCEADCAR